MCCRILRRWRFIMKTFASVLCFLLQLIVMYLQILMLADSKHLMQKAWNYMNDSLRTEVFLRYSPETVACACIYLSARVLRIPLPKNPSWFIIFGVKEEDIIDVCRRIVNLYNRGKVNYSFTFVYCTILIRLCYEIFISVV